MLYQTTRSGSQTVINLGEGFKDDDTRLVKEAVNGLMLCSTLSVEVCKRYC